MTIEIPPGLQWVSYLAGSEWPKGDESAMFRLGSDWHDSASQLSDLIPDLAKVRTEVATVLAGDTAKAAQDQFAMLFDGDYAVDKLADAMSALGDLAKDTGSQIEYSKLQIISTLVISAAEILYALAQAPWTFGGSLSWIPVIEAATWAAVRVAAAELRDRIITATTAVLSRTVVKELSAKAFKQTVINIVKDEAVQQFAKQAFHEAVEETVTSTVQEFAIEGYQNAEGHHHGFNLKQIVSGGFSSAVGGAAGAGAHHQLSGVLGDATSVVGKISQGAFTHFEVGVVGNVAGSVAGGGGLDGVSVFGGAAGGAVSGGVHGSGGHGDSHPEPKDAESGAPVPDPPPPYSDPPPPYPGAPESTSDSVSQPPPEGADRQSDAGGNNGAPPQLTNTAQPSSGGAPAAAGQSDGASSGNGAASSAAASVNNGAAGNGAGAASGDSGAAGSGAGTASGSNGAAGSGAGAASAGNGAVGNGAAGSGAASGGAASVSNGAAGNGAAGNGAASVNNGAAGTGVAGNDAASVNSGAAGSVAAGNAAASANSGGAPSNGAVASVSNGAAGATVGSSAPGGGAALVNNGAAANNGSAGNGAPAGGAVSVNNGAAGSGAAPLNNGATSNGATGTGLAGNPVASVGKAVVGGGTDSASAGGGEPLTSTAGAPEVGGVGGKGGLPSTLVPGNTGGQVNSATGAGPAAIHGVGARPTTPPNQPADGAPGGQRPSPSRPSAGVTSTTHGDGSPATRKADTAAPPPTTKRPTGRIPQSSRLHGLPSDGTDVPMPTPAIGSPSTVGMNHAAGQDHRGADAEDHASSRATAESDGDLPVTGSRHIADRGAHATGSSQKPDPTSDVHSSESRASRPLPTPPTDEPLVAPIPHSDTTIDAVRNWIGDINHDGDPTAPLSDERLLNCGPATIAVFQRLSGTSDDARANLDVYAPDDLGVATGLAVVPNSRDGIAQHLVDEGPGAHTTVVVHFAGGEQHAFNAFYDGTEVHAIDGQRRTVSSWPPQLDRVGNPVQSWFMGTPFHGDPAIFDVPDRTAEGHDGVPHRSAITGAAPSPGVRRSTTDAPTELDPHVADTDDGDGDGWVVDADGTPHWGRYGAAGLLLRAWNSDGAPVVLLQRRAEWTDEGGTWGLPGGARNRDETVEQAALRETVEETGLHGDRLDVRAQLVTARAPGIDWTYSTVIGDAPYPMRAASTGEGTHRWVAVDEVAGLPLHSGLADSWEGLLAQMAANPLTPPRPSPQLDPTIDPTDVSGVYAIGNPEGVVYYRDDNNLLYREDTRPPEVIFAEGFAVHPDYRKVNKFANFISTTRDPNLRYLKVKTTERVFRYTIDAPGGVDVNRTVGIGPSEYQQEISFPGGIRRENIRSAVEVLLEGEHQGTSDGSESANFTYGSVHENPYFKPDTPNDGAPRVLLGPLGGRQDADEDVPDHVSSIQFRDSVSAASDHGDRSDASDVYMAGLEDSPGEIQPTSPEPPIGPGYDSLYVPFDRASKSVDGDLHAEVADFVSKVVGAAERRYGAGETGLVLHAEGGGNDGLFSRGAHVVGERRANAVVDAIRPQIERALEQKGMPADFVEIPDPTSRGRALTDDLPGSSEKARRRVVLVRIENQPTTKSLSAPHRPEESPASPETSLPNQDSAPPSRDDLDDQGDERSDVDEPGTRSAGASDIARFAELSPQHGADRELGHADADRFDDEPVWQPRDSASAVDLSRSSPADVGLDSAVPEPALSPARPETPDDDDDWYRPWEEHRTRTAAEHTDPMPEVGLDDSSGSPAGDHRPESSHAHQSDDSTPPRSPYRSVPAGLRNAATSEAPTSTTDRLDDHQRGESFLNLSPEPITPTPTRAPAAHERGQSLWDMSPGRHGDAGTQFVRDSPIDAELPPASVSDINPSFSDDATTMSYIDPGLPGDAVHLSEVGEEHSDPKLAPDIVSPEMMEPNAPSIDEERAPSDNTTPTDLGPADLDHGGGPLIAPMPPESRLIKSPRDAVEQQETESLSVSDGDRVGALILEHHVDHDSSSHVGRPAGVPDQPSDTHSLAASETHDANTPPMSTDDTHSIVLFGDDARQLPVLPDGPDREHWNQVLEQAAEGDGKRKGKQRQDAPRRLWDRYVEAFNAAHQASRAGSSQEAVPEPARAELAAARTDLTHAGLNPDALTNHYRDRFDPPEPSEPPKPQLPARIGPNLVLGGSDVIDEFNSGDEAFKYFETVVREQAGDKAWEDNRERIAAQFTDLALRPKAAGMLRGGRPIAHVVDLGFGRTLTLDIQLIGASEHSKLDFESIEKDYEFEHTSDPTTVVGSLDDGRNTVLAGAQANLTIPNLNATAGVFGTGAFERARREQRADRQISGAQTVESAHRFHGNIRAVLSHRKSESPGTVTHRDVDFYTKLVVPSRDVTDRAEPNEADEARDTLGPLPSHSTTQPAPPPGDPPKVRYTHALSGSDVVTNLWLIPDDEAVTAGHGAPPADGTPPPPAESRNSSGSTGPQRAADAGPPLQTVTEFLDSEPMKKGLRKAYGIEGAEQAKTEMSQWLTVELVQAYLHSMTNKQPLVLEFDHIDGAWVEVHAFIEPLGTPNHSPADPSDDEPADASDDSPADPSDDSPAELNDHAVGQPDRMFRPTGKTAKTEFHFGAETDTTEVRQNVVTWSAQLPTVRIRGQGDVGSEVGLSGGADGTWTEGHTREETHSRQFRQRNTLKLAVPGQGLHGQVRLRFEMHSRDAVSPRGRDAPFKGAVVETRGRFDVLMEQSETEPAESLDGKTVWAPPQRIWGIGRSDERNSVAKSPWWWPLGTGGRTTARTGGAAYWPSPPKVNRGAGEMAELRGLGSMDRVTNLDLSGFRGMLDSMGHRAFGGEWKDVRAAAGASHDLNVIRASLPGMSQKSPLIHSELSGPGSSTKTAFTADFEQLTFRRVISTLASPSAEATEGSAITTIHNRQASAQGALGPRGGEVAGSPVAGEVIAGVTQTVRDGDRGRNQDRVAVATKFEQKLAVFHGWVRLDGTMVGSKATVHESGLFRVEIAIPLTDLQASRLHDSSVPPTFTKAHPNGFVDHPRPEHPHDPVPKPLPPKVDAGKAFGRNGVAPTQGKRRSFRDILKIFAVAPGPVPPPGVGNPSVYLTDVRDGTAPPRAPEPPPTRLDWDEPPPVQNPPEPPAHTLLSAWHPSDMLLGVDPSGALVEAIREDLAPALGSGLDDAMAGVADQFGPNVLTARLTHESGQQWIHDIPVPGGSITVKVRPVREPTHEYIGPSEKFETDLSLESQSAVSHIHDDVVRTVVGARVQIPFPHGSLAVQATHSGSLPHSRMVVAAADQGASQLTDASGLNITGESDHRIPLRVRTTQPHDLFRHPIRFEISYEKHLGANLLSGIPDTPEPVRVSGVFSYPKHTPTPVGTGIERPLNVDQVVLEVRPHVPPGQFFTGPAQLRADAITRTAREDLIANHVLDRMRHAGAAVFGDAWPKVRAELAPHVRTMVIQRTLGSHSRGGKTPIELKSVPGGKVVLGAHVNVVYEADSKATSEFYSGGQHQLTAGVSSTKASNYALVIQAQGDVLPTGPTANVSVLGRIDGGYGNEALNTRTESSSTSLLFRKKVESQAHIGTATIEATMSRPTKLPGFTNNLIERTATAQVDFLTRRSPKDTQDHPNYVPRAGIIQRVESGPATEAPAEPGPAATQPVRGLSRGTIVRAITDGDNFRAQTQANVRAKLVWWKNARIQSQILRDLSDTRVVRDLPAMTRREVELLRHGSLRITGKADVQKLDFQTIEHKSGNTNVLNEVNQTRLHQDTRAYDFGLRALFGVHGRLPHLQGSVLGGGGANHRGRHGISYAQGAKVTANVKYEDSFAVFHGSTRITLTVHDGTTKYELSGVDVHGPIMLPLTDVTPADAPVHSTPALDPAAGLPEISTVGPSLGDDRSEPVPSEDADVGTRPRVVPKPVPFVDMRRAAWGTIYEDDENAVIFSDPVSFVDTGRAASGTIYEDDENADIIRSQPPAVTLDPPVFTSDRPGDDREGRIGATGPRDVVAQPSTVVSATEDMYPQKPVEDAGAQRRAVDVSTGSSVIPNPVPSMDTGRTTGGVVDAHENSVVIPDAVVPGTFSPHPPVFTSDRPSTQLQPEVDATRIAGIPTFGQFEPNPSSRPNQANPNFPIMPPSVGPQGEFATPLVASADPSTDTVSSFVAQSDFGVPGVEPTRAGPHSPAPLNSGTDFDPLAEALPPQETREASPSTGDGIQHLSALAPDHTERGSAEPNPLDRESGHADSSDAAKESVPHAPKESAPSVLHTSSPNMVPAEPLSRSSTEGVTDAAEADHRVSVPPDGPRRYHSTEPSDPHATDDPDAVEPTTVFMVDTSDSTITGLNNVLAGLIGQLDTTDLTDADTRHRLNNRIQFIRDQLNSFTTPTRPTTRSVPSASEVAEGSSASEDRAQRVQVPQGPASQPPHRGWPDADRLVSPPPYDRPAHSGLSRTVANQDSDGPLREELMRPSEEDLGAGVVGPPAYVDAAPNPPYDGYSGLQVAFGRPAARPDGFESTVAEVRRRLVASFGNRLPDDVDARIDRAYDDAYARLPEDLRRNYIQSGWSPSLLRELDHAVSAELGLQRPTGSSRLERSQPVAGRRPTGRAAGLPPSPAAFGALVSGVRSMLADKFRELPDDIDDWIAIAYEELPEELRRRHMQGFTVTPTREIYETVRDQLQRLEAPRRPFVGLRRLFREATAGPSEPVETSRFGIPGQQRGEQAHGGEADAESRPVKLPLADSATPGNRAEPARSDAWHQPRQPSSTGPGASVPDNATTPLHDHDDAASGAGASEVELGGSRSDEALVSAPPHHGIAADDSDDIEDLYETNDEYLARMGLATDAFASDRVGATPISAVESDLRSDSGAHRDLDVPDGGAPAGSSSRVGRGDSGGHSVSRADQVRQMFDRAAPQFPMSDSELEDLLAGVPPGLSVDPSVAECVPLAHWLIHALHPGGVRGLAPSDDSVLDLGGVAGAQAHIMPGPGWNRIRDLSDLRGIVEATPGTTVVIMASYGDNDRGHVFALHSATSGGVRVLDPQRRAGDRVSEFGETLSEQTDLSSATTAWAVVLDAAGHVVEPGRWSEHIGVAEAILDAPLSHDFGSSRRSRRDQPDLDTVLDNLENLRREGTFTLNERVSFGLSLDDLPSITDDQVRRVTALGVDLPDHLRPPVEHVDSGAGPTAPRPASRRVQHSNAEAGPSRPRLTRTEAGPSTATGVSSAVPRRPSGTAGLPVARSMGGSERPPTERGAPETSSGGRLGIPEASDDQTGEGVSKGKGKAKEKARETKRARDEHDDDGEQTAEPSRPTKRPKTESSASGKSKAAGRSEAVGPSTPDAPEAGKHRMTAQQVEAMLQRLADEIAKRGEGRWVSKIAKEFPGQLDPNRKWLTESGWTQKKHAQTLSRMPDYSDHRAAIQGLVKKLGLYEGQLPEPQGEYHIRFTAENLLAALRALRNHRRLPASERKRSAFKYVERQTNVPEQTLRRYLYTDGDLAVPASQLSRMPGYPEHRARLQEAFRQLSHDDTADGLPEPGARRVEEMTADVVAATLKRLAANPDRSMADIGRRVGFGREALLRYVGPRDEGLRRPGDLARLPNYAEQRDSIAAALRAMGRHDQARALVVPGQTDGTEAEVKPKPRAPGASLAARAPARAVAGLPIARVSNDRSDVKMSDPTAGVKASKAKARAADSEMLDSNTDHDDVASRVKREPDLSDFAAENSGAVEGDRHMTTARQVEAMLRRLEAENRNPPAKRATLVEIGREFPGTDGGNARWLSASTWATAHLDVVLSRTVDYEQHREAIQRLVTRLSIYTGTLPDPERRYHHALTAAELVEALRSRAGFQTAPQEERRGGAHVYMRRNAGLGDSPVLEKWIYADGKLKAALGQLNSLPGYATNRDQLRDAFRRLGQVETAENLPEPSARNVEEMTADVVAAALEMLARNPNLSMTVIGRELGFRSEALLRYIGPRNDGLREPSSLVRLPNYDAQQRSSIAAALEAMGQHDQVGTLPMPQVMPAADFLREMRLNRRQVGNAIEQMRQDPALLPRDAALAAGVPEEPFALAVDRGPTIRQQSNVEAQLSRVEPELRRGLDQTFERLGSLARGEQVDDAIPMTAVPLAKNPIAPTRLFVVENPDLEGKAYEAKLKRLYDANPALVRGPRSYADDRPRQLLRWMSTVLRERLSRSGEVQSYYDAGQKTIFVSSNTGTGNKQIRTLLDAEGPGLDSLLQRRESERQISRETRHWTKLKNALSNPHPHADKRVDEILEAIRQNRFHVPDANYQSNGETVDVHAERRIKYALESLDLSPMDLSLLAGTLRACGHCAAALGFDDDQTRGPFWQSKGAGYQLDRDGIVRENMQRSVGTNVTRTRGDVITADYNTDSEASSDEDAPPVRKRRASGAGTQNPKGKGADVKGKGVDRSGAAGSGDADPGAEQQDQWNDIDPVQLDTMLNRWDALPPGQEFEPDSGETQVIEQIRRGARLPGDLAERFERLGVRGPRPQPNHPESLMSDDPFDDDVEMADASSGEDMDLGTDSDAGSADESEQNRSHMPTKAPPAARAEGRGVDGAATAQRLSSDTGDQRPNRHRDNDFSGRRTQASPTATFSERFEASTDGPDGHGFLKGLTTQISYDQRRFQLPDESWVRDFEIRLQLKPASGIGHDEVTLLQHRLSDAVDRDLNDRYELPGGDKLNVTLIFDAPKPHGTVTVHGAADTNQQNFSVHAPNGVLTHEILHYLGLPEGYRDPKALLARSLDPDGPMGEHAAHGDWRLSAEQLAKIDEIAHHGPVHDLAHGATPMPVRPRDVLNHEPVAAHEPTPAPDDRPGSLDDRFGDAVAPKNVKKSEKDDQGQVRLNPLWYRLEDFKPALLDRGGVWLYAIDEQGEIFIGSEDVWSIADDSEREALLTGMQQRHPELTMPELRAAINDQGVPTVAAGFDEDGRTRIADARVGGELFKHPATGEWTIDASSRYTGPAVRPGVEPARVSGWVVNAAERIGAVLGMDVAAQDAERPRIAHGAFVAGTAGPDTDEQFGPLAGPKKVKDREFDDARQVRLNPLWYRLEDFQPALLEREGAVWHYAVDEDGEILLGSDQLLTIAEDGELQALLEAMQVKDPELTMDQLKGFIDNQGHPTVAAGFDDKSGETRLRPARVSGELSFERGRWQVTDKSGRYMSNKVRPGLKAEDAHRWLTRVARDMSARFGVEVEAVLFKNATTTAHPAPDPAPPLTETQPVQPHPTHEHDPAPAKPRHPVPAVTREQRAGAGTADAATDDVAVNLGRRERSFGTPLYLPPFDEGAKSLNQQQTAEVARIAAQVVEDAASLQGHGRGRLVLHVEGGGNGGAWSKGPKAVGRMRADAVLAALAQEITRQLRARQIPEEMVTFAAPTSRATRLTNGIPQWGREARRVVVVHVEYPASS